MEIDQLQRDIEGRLSTGETAIARALASIWSGNGSRFPIDITDIAALDPQSRQPILDWLADPFWP